MRDQMRTDAFQRGAHSTYVYIFHHRRAHNTHAPTHPRTHKRKQTRTDATPRKGNRPSQKTYLFEAAFAHTARTQTHARTQRLASAHNREDCTRLGPSIRPLFLSTRSGETQWQVTTRADQPAVRLVLIDYGMGLHQTNRKEACREECLARVWDFSQTCRSNVMLMLCCLAQGVGFLVKLAEQEVRPLSFPGGPSPPWEREGAYHP